MKRILNTEQLTGHGNQVLRDHVCQILETGMQASNPYNNMKKLIRLEGDLLTIGNPAYEPIGAPVTGYETVNLATDVDRVFVVGAGKGIQHAAKALEDVLGDRLDSGFVIVKHGDDVILEKIQVSFGGHPLPDEGCVNSCNRLIEFIRSKELTERDLVITLTGNGMSSLLSCPVDEVPLEAVQNTVRIMQIEHGLNTLLVSYVRNQLDKLKGGRISKLLHPAKMVHALLIDCNYRNCKMPGYAGLTRGNFWLHFLPENGTPEEAIQIMKDYNVWDEVDECVRSYLLGAAKDNPTLTAAEFEQMNTRIFGIMPEKPSFITEAMEKARELGYTPHLVDKGFGLESSQIGWFMSNMGMMCDDENIPFQPPCALFRGGECVVTVGKNGGVGGRNQEFALMAGLRMAGRTRMAVGAVDTDGTDGPGGVFDEDAAKQGITCLAGGVCDGYTLQEAREKGIDLDAVLRSHATSAALWKLDSGVVATQNISLQDLVVILIQGKE